MSAKTVKDRLVSIINDATTLDVVTLKGELKFTVPEQEEGKKFGLDEFTTSVLGQMAADQGNTFTVVAFSHCKLDFDRVNYVSSDGSQETRELIDQHNAAVEASIDSRFQALALIGQAVGLDTAVPTKS